MNTATVAASSYKGQKQAKTPAVEPDLERLEQEFKRVFSFASTDASRAAIQGVLISRKGSQVTLTATDGTRLVHRRLSDSARAAVSIPDGGSAIVPKAVLMMLKLGEAQGAERFEVRLVRQTRAEVRAKFEAKTAAPYYSAEVRKVTADRAVDGYDKDPTSYWNPAELHCGTLSEQAIDENFPDYRRVIPDFAAADVHTIRVRADKLAAAKKACLPEKWSNVEKYQMEKFNQKAPSLAHKEANVYLTDSGQVVVTSHGPQKEPPSVELDEHGTLIGKPWWTAVDCRRFSTGEAAPEGPKVMFSLKLIEAVFGQAEYLDIKWTDQFSPARIDLRDEIHVVMPMRQ